MTENPGDRRIARSRFGTRSHRMGFLLSSQPPSASISIKPVTNLSFDQPMGAKASNRDVIESSLAINSQSPITRHRLLSLPSFGNGSYLPPNVGHPASALGRPETVARRRRPTANSRPVLADRDWPLSGELVRDSTALGRSVAEPLFNSRRRFFCHRPLLRRRASYLPGSYPDTWRPWSSLFRIFPCSCASRYEKRYRLDKCR